MLWLYIRLTILARVLEFMIASQCQPNTGYIWFGDRVSAKTNFRVVAAIVISHCPPLTEEHDFTMHKATWIYGTKSACTIKFELPGAPQLCECLWLCVHVDRSLSE